MKLDEIKSSCKTQSGDRLAIELHPSEKLLQKGELDTDALKVSYFDETHQMNLPVFASATVQSQGGCILACKLGENVHQAPSCTGLSGNLNSKLPNPNCWEKEIKKTKDRHVSYLPLLLYIAALALIPYATISKIANSIVENPTEQYPGLLVIVASTGFMFLFLTTMSGAFGILGWIQRKRNPDTVEFRDIHEKMYTKTFRAPLPGNIPQEARNLIKKEAPNYEAIHLLWEATNLWEYEGMTSQKAPNPDPIIFGETKEGKYIYLGEFDCTPRETTIKKFIKSE